MRIVGLDLSLTSTGVACIDVTRGPFKPFITKGDEVVMHAAHIDRRVQLRRFHSQGRANDTLTTRSLRLRKLAGDLHACCVGADLVVVEGPAYSSQTGHMHDRSGLWWLVIGRLTAQGIPTAEVTTQHLKTYALGKGGGKGTGKDDVLAATIHRYLGVATVRNNDEADSLVLAAMGARHLGCPIETNLPQTHLRAVAAVAWPNGAP